MIRPAKLEDLPALLRMTFAFHKAARLRRLATFEESLESWEKWLRRCIAGGDTLCLFAELDDKPAGLLTAIVFPAYWNDQIHAAHETTIWVEPEARGHGVGGELLEAFAAWGEAKGADILSSGSTVYMQPKEMGRMLSHHGFQIEERTYSRRIKCPG